MTQTEALKQLREVHAIQGRDGCWDIDDYMLGLYNGLELALSIVENRECRYKNRPKPEQEPVAWMFQHDETGRTMCIDAQQLGWGFEKGNPRLKKIAPLYTTPPQRTERPVDCERCNRLEEQAYDLVAKLRVANIKLSMQSQRTWVGLTDKEIEQLSNK